MLLSVVESIPSLSSKPVHISWTSATRHDGVNARLGAADQRAQHQTAEKED